MGFEMAAQFRNTADPAIQSLSQGFGQLPRLFEHL